MVVKRYTVEQFKNALNGDQLGDGPLALAKGIPVSVKEVEGEDSSVREFIYSTANVDRDNDTINVNGWELANYNRMGVFLWAHDKSLPPIAKPLATWVQDDTLRGRVKFTPQDMPHPYGVGFGHTVGRMFDEGFMRAVSVGFKPMEFEANEEREGYMPIDFTRQELLEVSAVPVPSNPEALHVAAGKGIDLNPLTAWAEDFRDKGGSLWVSKAAADEILESVPKTKVVVDLGTNKNKNESIDAVPDSPPAPSGQAGDPSSEEKEPDLDEADSVQKAYKKSLAEVEKAETAVVKTILKGIFTLSRSGSIISDANHEKLCDALEDLKDLLGEEMLDNEEIEPEIEQEQPEKERPSIYNEQKETFVTFDSMADMIKVALKDELCKMTGKLPD